VRIIGGQFKRRNIVAPGNLPVRPTTDFAKEALFAILNNYFYFDEITVLDLFSGTGNISYEFASREAKEVVSVDIHPSCINFIRSTAQALPLENIRVIKADVFKFLESCRMQFDVIFADPPYDSDKIELIPGLVFDHNLLAPEGMLLIEHSSRISFEGQKYFFQERKYGKVHFSMFSESIDNDIEA